MKYDMELTLRTELDTYAKQSFTLKARDRPSFSDALNHLQCQIDGMPEELRRINRHTLDCIFGEEEG